MKRKIALLLTAAVAAACALTPTAIAATTNVTATVTDTDGQLWTNGTWSATLIMAGGPFSNTKPTIGGVVQPSTASGVLSSSGVLTGVLTDTSSLDKPGATWQIRVCPNASLPPFGLTDCAMIQGPISGTSLDLTPKLNSVAAPRFPAGPGASAFGYSDIEVITPSVPGLSYFNTNTNALLAGLRMWDGHRWIAGGGSGTPVGPCGGDLTGTFPDCGVVKVQGDAIAATSPVSHAVMIWDAVCQCYQIRQATLDDLAAGFTINSFTGGSTVEIGTTVSSPSFAATYSTTPTSAAITNTDDACSPTNLTSPFTSGTVACSFTKTSAAAVTFTLTATGTSTKTATQQIQWQPRFFGGVGTPGATSSVTASGTNAVLSTSNALASAGISNSQVGTVIGSYCPSGQSIYLLLIGGSHTFVDNNTGFAMSFNAPTAVSFVNANGATVSMFLYQTTFTLNCTTTPFAPKVAS